MLIPTSTSAAFFRQSRVLCFYDMRHIQLHSSIVFPKATMVAIIRCSKKTIPSILCPSRFPQLQTIHYLSSHPGSTQLHQLFAPQRVKWVFPSLPTAPLLPFYQTMVESGNGSLDPNLLSTYLYRLTYSRYRSLRHEFDLHIPGLPILHGKDYRVMLYRYLFQQAQLLSDQREAYHYHILPKNHLRHPHDQYLQQKTEEAFYECLMTDDDVDD